MPNENNKMQVDIDTLKKQNVNDLISIKETYSKLEELQEKIRQIKYIDNTLVKKLKKEYEKLNKIILDENVQVKLSNDIETINTQMDYKANEIFIESFEGENDNEKLTNALKSITTSGVIKLKNKEYNFDSIVLKRGVSLKGSGNTILNATRSGVLIKTTDLNNVCDLNINDNGYKIKAIDVGQVGGNEKNYCNNCLVSGVNIHLNNISSDGIRLGHGNNNKIDHNTNNQYL